MRVSFCASRGRIPAIGACVLTANVLFAGEIAWRSGSVELPAQSPAQLADAIGEYARAAGAHVVVQFAEPLTSARRAALHDRGLDLLRYLGNHTYFAVLAGDSDRAGLLGEGLTHLTRVGMLQKVHPDFTAGDGPPWAQVGRAPDGALLVAAYLLLHSDVELEPAVRELAARYGASVRSRLRSVNGAVFVLPQASLLALAAEDVVQWVEPPLPGWDVANDSVRELTQADEVFAPPYGLTGAGVRVMVYDGGVCRATHVDFQGRLQNHDDVDPALHSTHVAGTIGGAGVASPAYRGMAPGVLLASFAFEVEGGLNPGYLYSEPGDLESDYDMAINVLGCDLANNSIGSNIELYNFNCNWQGDYGVTDALLDAIVRGSLGRPFRVIWAGGNERQGSDCDVEGFGDYYSIAPPAGAKNHVCVGAVNSNDDTMTTFSSWGPTDDGRLKPDVVAPGCQSDGDLGVTSCGFASDTAYVPLCGTSQAAPTVAGLTALLLQDYRTHYAGRADFRNSTLKALLVQTAADLGSAGPDYRFGYGSVRIHDAVDLLRAGNFLEAEVDQGSTYRARIVVAPGSDELRVTLAWDDAPGTPNVLPALVNDLDLRVFAPNGSRFYPWTLNPSSPATPAVRTGEDHRNNLEQVWVPNPQPGFWNIEVHGTSVPVGPQTLSLAGAPVLRPCSSAGTLALDASVYACEDLVALQVVDCDLNVNDGAVETVTVSVVSNGDPAGEAVVLTETAPDAADFRGILAVSSADVPGMLRVVAGDMIVATYLDADNGFGEEDVAVSRAATTDCAGPQVSGVEFQRVGPHSAEVTFTTDEPALGSARVGITCDALGPDSEPLGFKTAHNVVLDSLSPGVRYYFALVATDAVGNVTVNDNAGGCFSFHTPELAYDFPLDEDPGWSRQGQWAWGVPTGGGSQNQDPTSGRTGSNVFGYNLDGDYPNLLPPHYLTTTPIDCTGFSNVTLSFWRWLGVESHSGLDDATLEVSRDGADWHVIWRATDTDADVVDSGWVYQEFDLSEEANDEPIVYVRWGMGPTDQTVTLPGWNIDDVQIYGNAGTLAIGFPEGLPALLTPGVATTILVRIVEGSDRYVAGSGLVHYRFAPGPFVSAPLVPLEGSYYLAVLPPTDCEAVPEFYFSAVSELAGLVLEPPAAPADFFGAGVGELVTVVQDDFELDLGWVVSGNAVDGSWQRGVPVNGGRGDPPADHDGSGKCYVTDNYAGNSDVDGGATILTSPLLAAAEGMVIQYAYWLNDMPSNPLGPEDYLRVEFATNAGGTNWQMIREYHTAAAFWRTDSLVVGPDIPSTGTLRIRFTCADNDPGDVVEGGLDAFVITDIACTYSGSCSDGIVNQGEDRIDCGGPCPACECLSDAACDDGNSCNGIEFCNAWGHCEARPITDCNGNASDDGCDLANGISWDDNGNGVPDECESMPGDVNCNGDVSLGDINPFVLLLADDEAWLERFPGCLRVNGDVNADGKVDFRDINPFVQLIGGN